MKIVLLLLTLALAANCMRVRDCDLNRIPNIFDLDAERLMGIWYPVDMSLHSRNYDCFKINFISLGNNTFQLEMLNQTSNDYLTFATNLSNERKDTFVSSGDPNALYRFYTIIDTDYDNYMVAIYCVHKPEGDIYYAHILSRTFTLSEDLLLRLQNSLLRYFNFEFKKINQGEQCLAHLS